MKFEVKKDINLVNGHPTQTPSPLPIPATKEQMQRNIAMQESTNDYSAVGPETKYGRPLGKYQIIPAFHFQEIGLQDTPEDRQKFLNSPALQDNLNNKILDRLILKHNGDTRKAAAEYYGGPSAVPKLDQYGGSVKQENSFPSINEYADKVAPVTTPQSTDPLAFMRAVSAKPNELYSDKRPLVERIPGIAAGIARSTLQAPQRAIASTGLSAAGGILSLLTGRDATQSGWQPKNKVERMLFGTEEIKPITRKVDDAVSVVQGALSAAGVNSDVARGTSLILAPMFVAGTTALDLTPFGGEKNTAELVAKSKNADEIYDLVSGVFKGKTREELAPVVDELVNATKPSQVRDIILKSKAADVATGGAVAQTVEQFADNINLSKVNTTDEVKDVIKRTAQMTSDVVTEQKRGVIPQAETSRLASMLGMTVDDLKATKIGTSMNAEEILAAERLMVQESKKAAELEARIIAGESDDALLNEYARTLNNQAKVQAAVSGVKAESGRALAIQKLAYDEGASATDKAQKLVFEAIDGQEITKDVALAMANARRIAESTGDFRPYYRLISQFRQPKFTEMVYEYWLNSILSHPVTHTANMVSNMVSLGTETVTRAGQAVVGSLPGTKKVVPLGEAGAFAHGVVSGLTDGFSRAWRALKYGASVEDISKLDQAYLPAIPGITGEIIRTPTRALSAEDEIFKSILRSGEMNAQAYRTAWKEGKRGKDLSMRMKELLDNPTEQMLERAKKTAEAGTFQTELGPIGKWVMDGRKKIPGFRYIQPFVRTPANLFKEAARISPLGFLDTASKVVEGAGSEEIQKSFVKASIGTAIAAGVSSLYAAGLVTGSAPEDKDKARQFYESGKKPFSIKIGDTWVSVARIEPFATILGTTADVWRDIDSGADPKEAAANTINTFINLADDKTFMQGYADLLDVVTGRTTDEKMSAGKKLIFKVLSGLVPNASKAVAVKIDPTLKDTKADDPVDELTNVVKAKLPFLSFDVPNMLGTWGQESPANTNLLSPFITSVGTKDPVIREIDRLDTAIGMPQQSRQVGGVKGKLTRSMYRSFVKDAGEIGHARVNALIQNPAYAALDDADKVDIIKDLVEDTRKKVREARVGELLLSVAGVDLKADKDTTEKFNSLYSQIIKTQEWKDMEDEDKLKMVIDDYATLILKK